MKNRLARKFIAMFFTLCMALSFVPIPAFATESTKGIDSVNINGVSGELYSDKDVTFATIDEGSHYTIESQKWNSTELTTITPDSENRKPTVGEHYSFTITLTAEEGYFFPIKDESNVFYDGVFNINGAQYTPASATVSSERKDLTIILFPNTEVKGPKDNESKDVITTVRKNYTDCKVTDDIYLKEGSDYIIDFTKEDNLSMALRALADPNRKDLEKAMYYKFENSSNDTLVQTENASEALIKIIVNKPENKAIMTLASDIDEDVSYALNFLYEEYTGSKLTYIGTDYEEGGKKVIIKEIEDKYYIRYCFDCNLNLISDPSAPSQTPDSSVYKIIEGANSSWTKNTDDALSFSADGDLSKFAGIKIDGEWLDKENYTATSGSTIITLKNEYLKTLSVGEHKITFVYTDGEVSTNFEVKESGKIYEKSSIPKTGDTSNILVWCSLFALSALIVFVITVRNKKKKSIV